MFTINFKTPLTSTKDIYISGFNSSNTTSKVVTGNASRRVKIDVQGKRQKSIRLKKLHSEQSAIHVIKENAFYHLT